MPSRWWVPIHQVRPEFVRLEHVHAAVSRWFDYSSAEHHAMDKPYTLSPLSADQEGGTGVAVSVLTEDAHARLRVATEQSMPLRLGNQTCPIGRPVLLAGDSWEDLAASTGDSQWRLTLLTPATFRTGNRTSPLPNLHGLLRSLDHHWRQWSPVEEPGPPLAEVDRAAWVSDLELTSEVLRLRMRPGRKDGRTPQTVSGVVGWFVVRCDTPAAADTVGPLLRLATYTGIGALTRKGLGLVRVQAVPRRRPPTPEG